LTDACCAPEEIYVGKINGSGPLKKIGQDEQPGTINDELPDISGRRAVWAHLRETPEGSDFDVNTRVLGGKVKSVARGPEMQWYPAVDGDLVAWEEVKKGSSDIWARRVGGRAVRVSNTPGDEQHPDVAGIGSPTGIHPRRTVVMSSASRTFEQRNRLPTPPARMPP
jgi:hypothetical protein